MRPFVLLIAVIAVLAVWAAPSGDTNSIGIAMVQFAPGSFEMGAVDGDYDEAPVHKVTLTKPFRMSLTEVTVEQYRKFKPGFRANPEYAPYASGISWNDAMAFCKWLSEREGKTYRLPTEAEWEYASRREMHNAIAQWVLDWHGRYPRDPQVDPVGPAYGIAKVVRGGGLDLKSSKLPYYTRAGNRASIAPSFESAEGNIGFRIVQAAMPSTRPLPYQPPMIALAVKQTAPPVAWGPDPAKPYYRTRPIFPDLAGRDMRTVGWRIGLKPGLGTAYHNSALQVCSNGDLVAAYYNAPKTENEPAQSILTMRLRYGAEDWDLPEPWPDFADAADAAPVFWNDRGRLWFFWGSPRLLGGPPFQFMTSRDNGATWSAVEFPKLEGPVGKFTPQPINSVVRGRDGVIYLPVDGSGGTSVLFASKDEGKTWYDTGGRTAGRHTTLVLGKDGSLIGFGGKNTEIDGAMPKAVTRDGGKTYEKSKTPFRPLGNGQRPSVIRLASGRLFFVADLFNKKKLGPEGAGAFVALSDDDGATWTTRRLPGIVTVGYTTATQGPDGVIHIVTSKNKPDLHIELNEAWVLAGGPANPAPGAPSAGVKAYRETYPNGKLRAAWNWADGTLEGRQVFYYENGRKQWETNFRAGRKTGLETWWSEDGRKQWERNYENGGEWTWRVFDENGRVTAESRWKGKVLLDAETEGKLP